MLSERDQLLLFPYLNPSSGHWYHSTFSKGKELSSLHRVIQDETRDSDIAIYVAKIRILSFTCL